MIDETSFVNNFAQWQPDQNMRNCLNCHTAFSFLVRKHHCRCCGGIFCGSCTDKFARYDNSRVRVVKRSNTEDEFPPFRTCDSCHDNLLHMGLLLSPWGKRLEVTGSPPVMEDAGGGGNSNGGGGTFSDSPTPTYGPGEVMKNANNAVESNSPQETTADVRRGDFDEENSCPICNAFLGDFESEMRAQEHVEKCIRIAEMTQQHHGLRNEIGSPTFQNRMLVYKIPPVEDQDQFPECPICFEEMVPGDKVGRLECLCVFHYKCIKSWFHKKAQKMKSNDVKYIGKNCCPLHDAVF
ncbi:hypothetical protein ZYGR_0I06010 [Zygosaccharomyces rouxii]|uniref:RING-type E3 ubiquitin transferase n=2 Tax=Zygosaccharomyces rouxii TaxID=4956 RepID=C5DU66_ZYGRC|nr:uncharacterized protein ZYRO0C14278g [Zygosaccharomyces rouxii]KAH9201497.1 FYVE zinc finger-domain-containing protein [Zygosaccharomyces rouxii]GAV48304.1 hypothetical protein ZYGR_0I06010 [Zygosaccharomyces rouxii]CAR27327.1 ZYRO0C14278p [Zygosaccharomyces rouxii]